MELVAEVEVLAPNPTSATEYVIDREELLRLREAGLIQDKLYVYLAIKLTYTQSEPSIDIPSFCEQWELSEVLSYSDRTTAQERGASTSCAAAAIGIILTPRVDWK